MNSIFTRRSVREFLDKEVELEKIDKILRAAMQSPSAANQQPWKFLVVRGRKNLDKLSKYNPHASSLLTATLSIIVLGDIKKLQLPLHWEQDLGACTQNILLQASELGLGSVWFGTAPDRVKMEFIQVLYDLDETLLPFSVIGLGYPEDEKANTFIDRFDESRIKYIN